MMNTDVEKSRFLEEFGDDYGYPNAPKNIDEIRATEFNRLKELVYLDHAGATLYSESQLEAIFKSLNSTVYGNPHTQSNVSTSTSDIVREARQQILDFCNASAKEYKCVFTSGATAALKLVGEAFPWSSESSFMYTTENHNSVLGIREYALAKGAAAFAIDIEEAGHHDGSRNTKFSYKVLKRTVQRRSGVRILDEEPAGKAFNLFAFPSECNFSGVKFNLDLANIMKEDPEKILKESPHCKGSWMVLIDAAKGCATEPPDLSKYKADFVVISFYKLFGYPTGLGALIVRNDAAKLLKKTYFSGGTVAASIADIDFIKRREGAEESLEDGSISFLSIASIHHGFHILNTLTMSAISRHTTSLATYLRNMLLALRHDDGDSVCTVYGLDSKELPTKLGPTVSFNLKRPDGSWFGYHEVEKLASLSGIQLRTGCFCNPGACAKYLGLSHSDLLSNIEAGHVCWDDHDILDGKPTGAVRVSFGYMSTFEDAKKFMSFIRSSFVSLPLWSSHSNFHRQITTEDDAQTAGIDTNMSRYYLRSINIYPIKSCGGFSVDSWLLSSTGLLHDREWVIKGTTGEILTQKKVPQMCYISTSIDFNMGMLFVESPRCKERLQIKLESDSYISGRVEMEIHNLRYKVQVYGDEVDDWFSNAVGQPCTLLRSSGLADSKRYPCSNRNQSVGMCIDAKSKLNFVNEAQLLLISEQSVSDLNTRLSLKNVEKGSCAAPIQVNPMRFRPNLVIAGGEPYAEDGWKCIRIGNTYFTSLGGCNRCQMININYQAGEVQRLNEPLATLAAYRRVKGKIFFGILLRYDDGNKEEAGSMIQVGEEVYPVEDLL